MKQIYFYLSDHFSNFLQQLLILDSIDPNSLNNKERKIKLKQIIFQKYWIRREIYFWVQLTNSRSWFSFLPILFRSLNLFKKFLHSNLYLIFQYKNK
jgi:hypothetical protein